MNFCAALLACNRKLTKSKFFIFSSFIIFLLFYFYTYKLETKENTFQLSGAAGAGIDDGDYNVIYSSMKTQVKENTSTVLQKNNLSKNEILVLRYTKYFGHYQSAETLTGHECNYLATSVSNRNKFSSNLFNIPCRTTYDRKYLNESNALVFHSRDLLDTELPTGHRDQTQLWVYMQQESPVYTRGNPEKYPNIFNWTMTYRRDSDVYHPYAYLAAGATFQNTDDGIKSLSSKLTSKTGLVAWIISHCDTDSSRELFVLELQKYVSIDIFGRCGKKCPPSREQDCYDYVASTYKFYLSLENSLCTDYITEKFYKALEYHMLPIVYGGGVETGFDYSEIAPQNSYIDSRSFSSPKELANYILFLNKNDAEFLRYFEWKREYHVVYPHSRWCNLCQRLYEHFFIQVDSQEIKWYKDLWKWWNYQKDFSSLKDKRELSSSASTGIYRPKEPICISPPKRFTDFDNGLFGKLKYGLKWVKRNILFKI